MRDKETDSSKPKMPTTFIVEPAKLVGKSKDRWERFAERLKERDMGAVRPLEQMQVEAVEPPKAPEKPLKVVKPKVMQSPPATVPQELFEPLPQPRPMPPDWMPNLEEFRVIREAMSKHAHDVWMKARATEKGWHNPKDCPRLKTLEPGQNIPLDSEGKRCPQCHPCMVPYEEMPKTEQDIDRAYPNAFLKILAQMGYVIAKIDKLP